MKFINWWIIGSLLMFTSCFKEKSEFEKLKFVISESYERDLSNFNAILVLEENSCIACNKAYADLVYESMNDSVLLIIAAAGAHYNVDIFNNIDKGVVINDY